MLPLLGTIVVASLVGSLHCAGMCGAFVTLACGCTPSDTKGSGVASRQAGYHLGRLVGYASLGTIAGALGSLMDLSAAFAGLSRVAMTLGAITLLVIGLVTILTWIGIKTPAKRAPKWAQSAFRRVFGFAQRLSPTRRASVVGLATVLLPCGWLYAFAVVAAGTASPIAGAAVMGAFWIGTVPILSAVGLGTQTLIGRLGPMVKPIAGVAVLTLGAITLANAALAGDAWASLLDTTSATATEVPTEADCPLCHDDPVESGE